MIITWRRDVTFFLFHSHIHSSSFFAGRMNVASSWITTSCISRDGGIISRRRCLAGILIYGYCMMDVPTFRTDEHCDLLNTITGQANILLFPRRKCVICNYASTFCIFTNFSSCTNFSSSISRIFKKWSQYYNNLRAFYYKIKENFFFHFAQ